MLAIVVLLPLPLQPAPRIKTARSPSLCSCLPRSRQSPVSGRLARHTICPVSENVPRILDRRPQKGCAGNWPQSRLTHSTHFHESGRYHRPAMRKQAATHFPASPVVPPSRNQSPASLYPPGTADLPPAVG